MYRQHDNNMLVTISRPTAGRFNSMLHFNCAEHNFQFNAAKLYSLAGNTTQQQQNPIPPTQFRTTIQFTCAQRANPQGHCP